MRQLHTTTTMTIHQKIQRNVEKSQRWWEAYVHIARYAYPLLHQLHHKGNTKWEDGGVGLAKALFAMDYIRKDYPMWMLSNKEEATVQEGCEWFGKNFTRLWD